MDNPRPEKVAVVEEVRARLDAADAAILTEYRGLSVKDLATLRRALSAAGGTYKVYKNTLVRFAVRDLGLDDLESLLTGPTAITFVEGDAVEVAKALRDFARTHPLLVVKGGVLGTSVLSPADAAALADLPSRDMLLARLAGALAAPMVQFAGLLGALPRNFAYGLKALIDQGGAPGAPSAPAPAAEEPAIETPAGEEPAAEEPAAEAPAVDESVAEEPATDEPAAEQPAADEPTAVDEAPAAEEPAAEEPAAEEPAAVEPSAEEPAAEEPASDQAPAEEPPAEEPASEDAPPAEPTAADVTGAEEPAAEAEAVAAEEPAGGATDESTPTDPKEE